VTLADEDQYLRIVDGVDLDDLCGRGSPAAFAGSVLGALDGIKP
jgi:hypothetical protein